MHLMMPATPEDTFYTDKHPRLVMNLVYGLELFSNSKLWNPFHASKQVFFIFLGTSESR